MGRWGAVFAVLVACGCAWAGRSGYAAAPVGEDVPPGQPRPVPAAPQDVTAQPAPGPGMGDEQLLRAVRLNVAADPLLSQERISVVAHEGVVTVTGSVRTLLAKDRVAQVIGDTVGVVAVRDSVTVEVPQRDDETLQLMVDRALAGENVTATVQDGVVVLRGEAADNQTADGIEARIKAIAGVKDVDRGISVGPSQLPAPTAAAPEPAEGEPERAPVDDETLTREVNRALGADPLIQGTGLWATVQDGVAILHGRVTDEAVRVAAELTTGMVTGVQAVENRVEVLGDRPDSDQVVRRRVMSALERDPRLHGQRVVVSVREGHVTLHGNVDSAEQVRIAAQVAGRVRGVRQVINGVVLRPSALE